jgi:hypothetical protein
MNGFQEVLLFGLLSATCVGVFTYASETRKRLLSLEKRSERQLAMLVALLEKSGIDPVTLD